LTDPERAPRRVLLTGATGFVGGNLYPALVATGHEVVCASRRPEAAARRHPERRWIRFDAADPTSYAAAFRGVDAILYLVHGMAETDADYEARERAASQRVADAAAEHGVERIVYLGGVAPAGRPSKHLRSRLATGEILRAGKVPTFELRAGMIIGPGSESWCIVRDLSVRLPVMLLPRWLQTESRPIAIDDVVAALVHAVSLPIEAQGCYGLPGPETLTGQEILFRAARLRERRPRVLTVPFVTPRLSSYWIQLVTRADPHIARELVEGMTSSLVGEEPEFWTLMPDHVRLPFDEAGHRALERETLPRRVRWLERAIGLVYRKAP
jgi:uncharacterized protein YbjT (DUF2867 family)